MVFNYAVSLMREKKFSAAVVPLRRVTREMPEFAGGWQALALTLRERKQYDDAIIAYEKALELAPDPTVAYNLGVTARRAKNWDRAVAAYDQALELEPGNLEIGIQSGRGPDARRAAGRPPIPPSPPTGLRIPTTTGPPSTTA